jgi:FkbM family methyltransferase
MKILSLFRESLVNRSWFLLRNLFAIRYNSDLSLSQAGQDFWVIHEVFNGKQGGFFIEIGSTNGIHINNTYLLEKRYGWNGLCIEPNPLFFQDLVRNRSSVCLDVCLDEQEGEVDFVFDGVLGGILDEGTDNHRRVQRKKLTEQLNQVTRKIKTTTFEKVLIENQAPKVIDYLSLDVEGAETRILRHFPFDQYTFLCMTIERPDEELQKLLANHGYIVVKSIPGLDTFFIHESIQKEYRRNVIQFYGSLHLE